MEGACREAFSLHLARARRVYLYFTDISAPYDVAKVFVNDTEKAEITTNIPDSAYYLQPYILGETRADSALYVRAYHCFLRYNVSG